MERVSKANPNMNPDFIGSWIIKPTSICDELIDYFEERKGKQKQGVTVSGLNTKIIVIFEFEFIYILSNLNYDLG